MPGESSESHPRKRAGENLAGDSDGGHLPDLADGIEGRFPFRIPFFQHGVEEYDSRHGKVGELESQAPDDARSYNKLRKKRYAKHP